MTPSPFVVQWVPRIAADTSASPGSALDVAMGRGRHVTTLGAAGYTVYGVDVDLERVRDARARAAHAACSLRAWCADLTVVPLPRERFDLVLVARYLQRDLFSSLGAAVKPGGVVLYETFTVRQLRHGRGPTSGDHLLQPGELARGFESFDVLFYEECDEPEAVARVVARRPSGRRGT